VIADGRMVEVATPETLGGRGARTARVCWLSPDGMREVRTDEPTAEVARLMAQYGGEVPELEVRRPSLEDIYLELIGRPAAAEAAAPVTVGAVR
jgi:ABC-2 type transport system ATP-binding protein